MAGSRPGAGGRNAASSSCVSGTVANRVIVPRGGFVLLARARIGADQSRPRARSSAWVDAPGEIDSSSFRNSAAGNNSAVMAFMVDASSSSPSSRAISTHVACIRCWNEIRRDRQSGICADRMNRRNVRLIPHPTSQRRGNTDYSAESTSVCAKSPPTKSSESSCSTASA